MLWAAEFHQQRLDPIADLIDSGAVSQILSTFFAALPVLVLFYLLVPRRWLAPWAGAVAALSALVVAVLVYGMSPGQATMAFLYGAGFGLLPVGWTIFNAMLLYNITVTTGQFDVVRRSVASLSNDARVQSILIAFAFGAFLEGAAGGGTPVAICGAILVGLGFSPFQAAVLCLIANTSPVAYGGLGTPLIVLGGVTENLPTETLSVMAGHQLPFLSLIVPLYMVRCMCTWKQTWEVWPCLLVAGGSFALFQYFFATSHLWIEGLQLYPMTDIGGGIFSLVCSAIFLRFWKPKTEMPPEPDKSAPTPAPTATPDSAHAAEAEAAKAMIATGPTSSAPLTLSSVALAWTPFALMSVFLMLTGLVRQVENRKDKTTDKPTVVHVPGTRIQTNYLLPVPWLHGEVVRDQELLTEEKRKKQEESGEKERESAMFNFAWLTAPGTAVLFAALASMFLLRMSREQVGQVLKRTVIQMKIPIPTICFMLGLSYVTRYSGMDATLGVAFAKTGVLYPFFAPMLGWLGVFLTGTDAGSNALFGSLQQITARKIFGMGVFPEGFTQKQAEILICTSNSTGGVMGKMIDAQSIVVATAATNQIGREADIFKAVLWHSIILAAVVGVLTVLQAYVFPFTLMVPKG
jgi:L-lactate transport